MPENTDWDRYLSTRRTNAYTDREAIRPHLCGKLLEIGCGFGDFAAWCGTDCGCVVSGVDPSPEAIAHAKKIFPPGDFSVGVAEALPFPDNTFDTAVSLEVVEHLTDPRLFFREAARVLRPGGTLVVQTPNYPVKRLYDCIYWMLGRKKDPWDDPTHVSPQSAARLKRYAQDSDFCVIAVVGRNILGERRLGMLRRLKRRSIGRFFWQKTILIARKRSGDAGSIDKTFLEK